MSPGLCQLGRGLREPQGPHSSGLHSPGVGTDIMKCKICLGTFTVTPNIAKTVNTRGGKKWEVVNMKSRLSQKMGKRRKKKGERKREGEKGGLCLATRPKGQGSILTFRELKYNRGHKTSLCTKQRAGRGSS